MKKTVKKAAARHRAAAFLLLLGVLLPSVVPGQKGGAPDWVERLTEETLQGEWDPGRLAFVHTACMLIGQVGYFWGGKSREPGWNRAWGWPRQVTSPGSGTTGHIRPYGLDCSGLVSWAAATALGEPAYDRVGEGTREQFGRCEPAESPRPGDLAFFPDLSHVGVVLGRDGGETIWVAHCSSSLGGVVVTPASYGFTAFGTPPLFSSQKSVGFPY